MVITHLIVLCMYACAMLVFEAILSDTLRDSTNISICWWARWKSLTPLVKIEIEMEVEVEAKYLHYVTRHLTSVTRKEVRCEVRQYHAKRGPGMFRNPAHITGEGRGDVATWQWWIGLLLVLHSIDTVISIAHAWLFVFVSTFLLSHIPCIKRALAILLYFIVCCSMLLYVMSCHVIPCLRAGSFGTCLWGGTPSCWCAERLSLGQQSSSQAIKYKSSS